MKQLTSQKYGSVNDHGVEWIIDALNCDPEVLSDQRLLERFLERTVSSLKLHPIETPQWYRFPKTNGLTGIWILKESHLSCHTFPEYRSMCFNIFCCRSCAEGDWKNLFNDLGQQVQLAVKKVDRFFGR